KEREAELKRRIEEVRGREAARKREVEARHEQPPDKDLFASTRPTQYTDEEKKNRWPAIHAFEQLVAEELEKVKKEYGQEAWSKFPDIPADDRRHTESDRRRRTEDRDNFFREKLNKRRASLYYELLMARTLEQQDEILTQQAE